MLRFRLGSIPVEVHFQHLLFSALFALLTLLGTGEVAEHFLRGPLAGHGAGALLRMGAYVAAWMAILFVSALAHELGHALTSRAFGYRPRIHLLWMGGHTLVGAEEVHPGVDIPWHRDVLLMLAGPACGLLVAGFGLLGASAFEHRVPLLAHAFSTLALVNFFWALINLVPIHPLDGARVARVILVRIFGDGGQRVAKGLSIAVTALAVLGALLIAKDRLLAGIFGLWLLRAAALPIGRPREKPLPPPRTPEERAFALAQESYQQGELEAARRRCLLLLDDEELPRAVRSRAHHLLGWIALKEGKGRRALDHFSQVGESPRVEVHALAAAFSLIGDEPRALSLWELAYRETKNPVILHEWAGALLRAGKEDLARKLPQVDMALAFQCAERVLSLREDHVGAARMGLQGLAERPSAQAAYDTACAFARAGDVRQALTLLTRAKALGFRDKAYAETDADLAALQGEAEFTSWLASLEESPAP